LHRITSALAEGTAKWDFTKTPEQGEMVFEDLQGIYKESKTEEKK